jgi:CubicO group peptidase (beta-lactamase class C family)
MSFVNSQNLEDKLEQGFEDFNLMGMSLFTAHENEITNITFGFIDFERNLPITNDTEYRIASISKSVTALGVMKLVNDGAINLDDDISEQLGYSVKNKQFTNTPITHSTLFPDTSSLQDGSGYSNFLKATYSIYSAIISPRRQLLYHQDVAY